MTSKFERVLIKAEQPIREKEEKYNERMRKRSEELIQLAYEADIEIEAEDKRFSSDLSGGFFD